MAQRRTLKSRLWSADGAMCLGLLMAGCVVLFMVLTCFRFPEQWSMASPVTTSSGWKNHLGKREGIPNKQILLTSIFPPTRINETKKMLIFIQHPKWYFPVVHLVWNNNEITKKAANPPILIAGTSNCYFLKMGLTTIWSSKSLSVTFPSID